MKPFRKEIDDMIEKHGHVHAIGYIKGYFAYHLTDEEIRENFRYAMQSLYKHLQAIRYGRKEW